MFLLEHVNTFPGGDCAPRRGKGNQIRAFQLLPLQEAWGEPHNVGNSNSGLRSALQPALTRTPGCLCRSTRVL